MIFTCKREEKNNKEFPLLLCFYRLCNITIISYVRSLDLFEKLIKSTLVFTPRLEKLEFEK